jgi:putative SOS response-associated peptidase YedK
MCYRKTLDSDWDILKEHYQASFESITEELDLIRERFQILMSHDEKSRPYTPAEIAEIKFCEKTLRNFTATGIKAYNENGFDHLAMPIVTAEDPHRFTLSRWGLLSNQPSLEWAYGDRKAPNTLNCRSEEMHKTRAYAEAVKNKQWCLLPVTSFFEPHWVDPAGKDKVTYLIRYRSQTIFSIAGLYNSYTDPITKKVTHSYTMLTQRAIPRMAAIHNGNTTDGGRMPFVLPQELERPFLNRELSLEDVLALGKSVQDEDIKAHTVAKMVTSTKGDTNVPEVLQPYDFGTIRGVRVVQEYK